VFSCTSNGALRRATFSTESSSPTQEDKASLPTRLRDWRLSSDSQNFTYGGEEVEVSVWNTEQAFQPPPQLETPASTGKKRKRSEALFPGEIWRAKNVRPRTLFRALCGRTDAKSGPKRQPESPRTSSDNIALIPTIFRFPSNSRRDAWKRR
jgi:hypothetical protein